MDAVIKPPDNVKEVLCNSEEQLLLGVLLLLEMQPRLR
jgi:hypothetical protein